MSVVVPTHTRPVRLARLLDSLREQTLSSEAFEVIVVDDGADGQAARVAADAARAGVPVRCASEHVPGSGPSAARNSGWRAARAPLVAFTDDDCRASAGWLSALVQAADAHPGAVLQGRTDPDPDELAAVGLLSRTVSVDQLGPQYETCNIAYPRGALEALGGFDERFGAEPAAEDTDLAWRAIERGWPTTFAPEALVYHAVERLGVRGTLRVARRWQGAVRVLAEHPQTRAILYGGVFWNVWHYLLWRSLLAFLGPGWLRRIVVRRHLRALRERAARAGAGPWAIAFLLVHDGVECWAVARGAIRHRTFVL